MVITSTWDNTADNPNNPNPRQWVVFGQRGVDEMSHLWLGITYLTDEQFERLSAERRGRLSYLNVLNYAARVALAHPCARDIRASLHSRVAGLAAA